MKESQVVLLESLAAYKFLTTEQMVRLGIVTHIKSIFRVLPGLRDRKIKPLIRRQEMEVMPGVGKLHDIYWLTKYGAEHLEEEGIMEKSDIRYLVGLPDIKYRDYKHRVSTVDIHLALKRWLDSIDSELLHITSYFDKPGSQRRGEPLILNKVTISEEKNRFMMPDIITVFMAGEKKKIIAWEQHNGKNTKKLFNQISKHIEVLDDRLLAKKLGLDQMHRIGVVFEHESIMVATMKRLMGAYGDDNGLFKFFIFKHNEHIQSDFFNHWSLWNGTQTTLLG